MGKSKPRASAAGREFAPDLTTLAQSMSWLASIAEHEPRRVAEMFASARGLSEKIDKVVPWLTELRPLLDRDE